MIPTRLNYGYSLIASAIEPTKPIIDDKIKQEWNNYVGWMASKGMKGKPELDTNELGFKMLDQYKKENPSTILSREHILPIQKEFQTYRQKSLENIKAGKAKFDGKEEDFMPGLSKLDGYPGMNTTSYTFPSATVTSIDNGKKDVKNIAFAPTNLALLK